MKCRPSRRPLFRQGFLGKRLPTTRQILVLWRMALDLEALPHSGFHPQVGDQQTNRPRHRKRQPDALDRPGKGNGREIGDAKHCNRHHQLDAECSYSVPRSQYSAKQTYCCLITDTAIASMIQFRAHDGPTSFETRRRICFLPTIHSVESESMTARQKTRKRSAAKIGAGPCRS